jgi:hypothetical protein
MTKTHGKDRIDTEFMSDAEVLKIATDLVEAFLRLVQHERPGHDILDATLLPANRTALENAFRLALMTEPREDVRRKLVAAGSGLAQFQDGVGQRVLLVPVHAGHPDSRGKSPQSDRIDALMASVESDIERLRKLLTDADRMAAQRFAKSKARPPFNEDGTYTWYGHTNS